MIFKELNALKIYMQKEKQFFRIIYAIMQNGEIMVKSIFEIIN